MAFFSTRPVNVAPLQEVRVGTIALKENVFRVFFFYCCLVSRGVLNTKMLMHMFKKIYYHTIGCWCWWFLAKDITAVDIYNLTKCFPFWANWIHSLGRCGNNKSNHIVIILKDISILEIRHNSSGNLKTEEILRIWTVSQGISVAQLLLN